MGLADGKGNYLCDSERNSMKEEVVGSREVLKSCFFVGCAAVIIIVLVSIGYLIWVFNSDSLPV